LNIFITGAAGGIGSTLALKLKQIGHKVIGYETIICSYIATNKLTEELTVFF